VSLEAYLYYPEPANAPAPGESPTPGREGTGIFPGTLTGAGGGGAAGSAARECIRRISSPEPQGPPVNWPPNRGYSEPPGRSSLPPGTQVDRYGNPTGQFLSPRGTPIEQRSLPPGAENRPYNAYEVARPFEVDAGPVAPAFNQPGGGTQFDTAPSTIQDLLNAGNLRPIP
jgi:hypothetical protein